MTSAAKWAIPLQLLVQPGRAWAALRDQPVVLPALILLSATYAATWLLNAQLYSEIAIAAAIGPAKTMTGFAVFAILLQSVLAVAAIALLLAAVLWVVIRVFSGAAPAGFRRCLILAVNGAMPLGVGWLYGALLLFFVRPLSVDFLTALSLLLKPYSLGLMTFLPGRFEALSLPWFLASYFDAFGVWTIILLCTGMTRFLGLDPRKLPWAGLALMLLLLLLVTGLWQMVQLGIASAV